PEACENLTGLARLVRAAVVPALENVALWHERDISHSAVERVIAPDATIALDFALDRLAGVIDGLVVYPDAMRRNLDRLGGLVHSQRVLLALTQAGLGREAAYATVQRHAMASWQAGTAPHAGPGGQTGAAAHAGGDFKARLAADPEVAGRLAPDALEALFDDATYGRHVDLIFDRVFPP
ncbi:MAG: adenylosuccinate lyase, partial [Alphaproteobacteria bacterium]